ncbi:MAG: DUF2147 domain-containing protein [Phycisphaerales bacterium]|nr:DUF2147 domain-containing protein [Phycisphaerales bacterium]
MQHLQKVALFTLGLFLMISARAESINTDAILGTWYNGTKTAKIEIYKTSDNKYEGKIVWLKVPLDTVTHQPRVDNFNPNKDLRTKPLLGLVILKNLEFNGSNWESGKIYDPKDGNTYSCTIKLNAPNQLNVRGYIGVSWIGRTQTWDKTTL